MGEALLARGRRRQATGRPWRRGAARRSPAGRKYGKRSARKHGRHRCAISVVAAAAAW
jgi:hypothetical protein